MLQSLFSLIRWPNLLIVFITQFIVWYQLVGQTLHQHNLTSNLTFIQFSFLSLATILVAASGNVINDIQDVKIDLINKPQKVIVGKLILTKTCYTFYYGLLGSGFVIAIFLGWQLDMLLYVLMYPFFAGCLYFYATHLKMINLIGNVLISLFVAAVPLIIFLADANQILDFLSSRIFCIILLYAVLAFLSNLSRELIKDMQDLKGDKAFGATTFPITFGLKNTKHLICLILIGILIILIYWTFFYDIQNQHSTSIYLGTLPLVLILMLLLISLFGANDSREYGRWSLGIKLFMLFGLLFLYLQPI